MVWVIALRECDLSEVALASGITSIIGYIAYLIWMIDTAPPGPRHLSPTTDTATSLMLTLLNAYATHDFMIQVITFNPNRKAYTKIVITLFIVSTLVFMFACFSAQGKDVLMQGWSTGLQIRLIRRLLLIFWRGVRLRGQGCRS